MEILGLGEGVAYQGDPTHIHKRMTSSLALVMAAGHTDLTQATL